MSDYTLTDVDGDRLEIESEPHDYADAPFASICVTNGEHDTNTVYVDQEKAPAVAAALLAAVKLPSVVLSGKLPDVRRDGESYWVETDETKIHAEASTTTYDEAVATALGFLAIASALQADADKAQEEADQADLDAEALEMLNAAMATLDRSPFSILDAWESADRTFWRAAATKARELHK